MQHKVFHRLRWIVMTLSFLFFIYGINLVGRWIQEVDSPVFACSVDTDQIFHGYCYNLSHLKNLFLYKSTKEIIIYLATLLIFYIVLGRVLCGFFCPMGYLQDIAWKIRELLHIEGMQRKERFMEILKITKYLILFIFFGITFLGFNFCRICPAVITTQGFGGFSQAITVGYFFSIVLFVMSFFMRRFWCNICPMGFLAGFFHKVSLFRLVKDCKACTKCGACYESCPMRIKSIYTEEQKKNVTTSECIFCGECVKKCPENHALAIAIRSKVFYRSSRKDFESCQIGTYKKRKGNGKK